MRHLAPLLLQLWAAFASADTKSNASDLSSHQILPSSFKPPQVFKNVNLMRLINLEKGYVRETINTVIENVDKTRQDEFFIPFTADTISKVGGLEVRDKKNPEKPAFRAELVEYDPHSPTQFYRVVLSPPISPKEQQTLSISFHVLESLVPLPAKINQRDKQYILHKFSLYAPSVYPTLKQKTKLKLPSVDVPDYTSNPERQGSTFTYGPFDEKPAGAEEDASVRYEFTNPIMYASLLERDVEISQWGGNLAIEERYWLENHGAHLSNHFSRVEWQMTQHYPAPTSALKELRLPLSIGSVDPYFTDDIGNVSTSRFRSNHREANLEIKPRYPVFGGWKYSFRIGWNNSLKRFLRQTKTGTNVLRVPFLEGPKTSEGISYRKVVLKFILPEGASNVKFESSVPLTDAVVSSHKTFMDTLGRSTVTLTAINLVDPAKDADVFVTYEYSLSSAMRKPIAVFLGILGIFVSAWAIGTVDTSIAAKVAQK